MTCDEAFLYLLISLGNGKLARGLETVKGGKALVNVGVPS
jgi:hypothetical protein